MLVSLTPILEVVEIRVGSVILLQLVNKLCKEQEGGWRLDIVWTLSSVLRELVIKGQPHIQGEASHDVLDQSFGEGDTVKVILLVGIPA